VSYITFTVPGDPRGKGSIRIGLTGGRRARPVAFKDAKTESYMNRICWEAKRALPSGHKPWAGPVYVAIHLYVKRPAKLLKPSSPDNVMPCITTPDLDNTAKAGLDAMREAGVYRDDKQVVSLTMTKHYPAKGRPPCTVFSVSDAPVGSP
jgi:Holliday junction resolvase RusA-like endonuclease